MATVMDFYRALDQWAPFSTQMEFDNAGFLVGRGQTAVQRVLVALDITKEVIEEALDDQAQLIIAHHPVIFRPVRSVTDQDTTGEKLLLLAENRIAALCAHTNLDAAQGGVNCCLAQRLELQEIDQLHQDGIDAQGRAYGIGRVGKAHREGMTAQEYAAFVKEKLGTSSVRFVDNGRPVCKVAVGGGSCGSMLADAMAAGCDTFVTSDVKHDQYLEAEALGINLMDAGHFSTENVITSRIVSDMKAQFPEVEILLSRRQTEPYQNI